MQAIVTAGGMPVPSDALYTQTAADYKVLLKIAGKPILQWVLDAIGQSKTIEHVVIVGMQSSDQITCELPHVFQEANGTLLENIETGMKRVLELDPSTKKILLISGDLPGINGQIIDWMAAEIGRSEHEFYYPVVERSVMEKKFPGAERTFVKLKEGEFCGGDVMGISPDLMTKDDNKGRKLVESRKNPLRQALILGLDMCLRLAVGSLSLEKDVPTITRRLGINGKAIVSPFAEMAMDVDKPHHLTVMEKYLTSNKERA